MSEGAKTMWIIQQIMLWNNWWQMQVGSKYRVGNRFKQNNTKISGKVVSVREGVVIFFLAEL